MADSDHPVVFSYSNRATGNLEEASRLSTGRLKSDGGK